jgi:hypothetical protein
MATGLLDLESDFLAAVRQKKLPEVPEASRERARDLARRALACSAPALPRPAGDSDEALLVFLEALLAAYALWSHIRMRREDLRAAIRGWTSFHLPEPMDYAALVPTDRPNASLPEERVGPASHRRRRDGFELTDLRMSRREVLGQTHYCLLCHEREKDSCSKGFFDDKTATFQKNPWVALPGCPLDEKISRCISSAAKGTRSGRSRSSAWTTRCARHRPPHLQRLHEGLHLPEAGASQHSADRDGRPDRCPRAPWGIEIYGR